jgi:hypothetical protein
MRANVVQRHHTDPLIQDVRYLVPNANTLQAKRGLTFEEELSNVVMQLWVACRILPMLSRPSDAFLARTQAPVATLRTRLTSGLESASSRLPRR